MSDSSAPATYFLSYSRADQEFALRLAGDLRASGVHIWVDQLDIRPSEHWDRAIERAVQHCRGLLVVLSPRSAASDNVADEISFALDHGKSVLPVMIERCRLPLRITRMQVIDATSDYGRALQLCVESMRGELPGSQIKAEAATPSGLDDHEAIEFAKRELTALLGPIASILVDREALRASSASELRARLAEHIPDERDREQFVAAGSRVSELAQERHVAPVSPIGIAEIDRLVALLTSYFGPIAKIIAARESASATSIEDLQQRLAMRIENERERAQFLEQVRKA